MHHRAILVALALMTAVEPAPQSAAASTQVAQVASPAPASPQPGKAQRIRERTKEEWARLKQRWAGQREKYAACRREARARRLAGRKTRQILEDCMTR